MTRRLCHLLCLTSLLLVPVGCRSSDTTPSDDGLVDDGSDSGNDQGDSQGDPPGKEGEGSAEHPKARQVARLSADQFFRALEVATGQSWQDYPTYAAALGKPDLAEVTEDGTSFSVSFDKFVHDAARATCRAAIDADLGGMLEGEPVLLRHAQASDRSPAAYTANLQYLLLRFLAIEVDADDERLSPWLTLLTAPAPEGEALSDERMADRWWAVCVGLATHPDFLSY